MRVLAKGRHLRFYINGRLCSEFTDNHPEPLESGFIGLQIHDAGMIVEFRKIELFSP